MHRIVGQHALDFWSWGSGSDTVHVWFYTLCVLLLFSQDIDIKCLFHIYWFHLGKRITEVREPISQETHLKGYSWTPGNSPPGLPDRTTRQALHVITSALSTKHPLRFLLTVSQTDTESRISACLGLLEIQNLTFLLLRCLFACCTEMSNVTGISGKWGLGLIIMTRSKQILCLWKLVITTYCMIPFNEMSNR